jgi:hypothetical protein
MGDTAPKHDQQKVRNKQKQKQPDYAKKKKRQNNDSLSGQTDENSIQVLEEP